MAGSNVGIRSARRTGSPGLLAWRSGSIVVALVVFVSSLGLASSIAAAQETPVTEPDTPQQQSRAPLTRENLMALIANEVVLAPGLGLRNIQLGEALGSVQNRLGPPASISRSGLVPRFTNLTYVLDGGTVVVLVGRSVVERIIVRGTAAGLIRTVQGARFGMDPNLIQRIYRNPTQVRGNRIEYRDRGITFYFDDNGSGGAFSAGVSQIEIYPRTA